MMAAMLLPAALLCSPAPAAQESRLAPPVNQLALSSSLSARRAPPRPRPGAAAGGGAAAWGSRGRGPQVLLGGWERRGRR
jgi:hypothetical protein